MLQTPIQFKFSLIFARFYGSSIEPETEKKNHSLAVCLFAVRENHAAKMT